MMIETKNMLKREEQIKTPLMSYGNELGTCVTVEEIKKR